VFAGIHRFSRFLSSYVENEDVELNTQPYAMYAGCLGGGHWQVCVDN
jgi:hypothetical protein